MGLIMSLCLSLSPCRSLLSLSLYCISSSSLTLSGAMLVDGGRWTVEQTMDTEKLREVMERAEARCAPRSTLLAVRSADWY